jgi:DNA-binding transcriptional ArsR family regulator
MSPPAYSRPAAGAAVVLLVPKRRTDGFPTALQVRDCASPNLRNDPEMPMSVFQILSEPIRRRVVEILASGEHTAGGLAEVISKEYTVTRQATSHHLAIMSACGIVSSRADWNTLTYRLEDDFFEQLHGAIDWLDQLWLRRYGWAEKHDPVPYWREPIVPRPYPRPPVGESRRGLRGKGRRRGLWAPMP